MVDGVRKEKERLTATWNSSVDSLSSVGRSLRCKPFRGFNNERNDLRQHQHLTNGPLISFSVEEAHISDFEEEKDTSGLAKNGMILL